MHNMEKNEHLPDYISKSFERVNWKHNYNNRHSFKGSYVSPKSRTETGIKSILYWDQRSGNKFHRKWNQNLCFYLRKNTPII